MSDADRRRVQARAATRKLLVQALYQWQLAHQAPAQLIAEFAIQPEYARVDREYFRDAISAICSEGARIDEELALHSEIKPDGSIRSSMRFFRSASGNSCPVPTFHTGW
jgi:transcription termination factor NusB